MTLKPVSGQKLAEQIGVSAQLINRKRRQGKSDDQIIAEAEALRKKRSQERPVSETQSKRLRVSRRSEETGGAEAESPETSFAEAQRRKELALAELREQELAQKRGELVPVEAEKQAWFKVGRALTDALFAYPEHIAQELAAITDPRLIKDRLLADFRQIAASTIPDVIRATNQRAA